MELRYTLAVVAPAGGEVGREVAVALARAGAAVLVVDPDAADADAAAALLVGARTRAWALQADVVDDEDAALVARRARDLGGADVVVDLTPAGSRLGALALADADVRRGVRSAQPVAVVRVRPAGGAPGTPTADPSGDLVVDQVPGGAGRTAADVLARLRR